MTAETETTVTSGDTQDATGGATEQLVEDTAQKQKDSVQYDTYKKVLGEKKKLQERFQEMQSKLDALETANKERTEQELVEQQEYKKLLDLKAEELQKTQTELSGMREAQQNAQKLDAFLGALGGKVERKYWGLIDLDRVVLNPESGEVDEMSVTKLVEEFRKEHGRLIDTPNAKTLPNTFPKGTAGTSGTMTLQEKQKQLAEYMINNRF